MTKRVRIVAIIVFIICVTFVYSMMNRSSVDNYSNDWDFIENLIKNEYLITVQHNSHIPILEEGDEEIVERIFLWVKDNKKTMWSSIDFWVKNDSSLINYSKYLVEQVRFEKRKVGLYMQQYEGGTLIRFNSNTIRVNDFELKKLENFGVRTSEQFLKLNPGTDISKPLTGEFYIF